MKINAILYAVLPALCLLSCRQHQQNSFETSKNTAVTTALTDSTFYITDTTMIQLSKIKKHLQLQENAPYIDFQPKDAYQPQEEDLLLTLPIIQEGLKRRGFTFPSQEQFDQKIQPVFGYTPDSPLFKDHKQFISAITKYDNNRISSESEFYFDFPISFFVKEQHFITEMLFLKDIITLQYDDTYIITIPYHIVARNNYIFYNDETALAWLIRFDKYFLMNLVEDHGYDREPEINKLTLELRYNSYIRNIRRQEQRIGDLIFTKDHTGTLQIRTGLLDYIEQNTSITDDRFIHALRKYMGDLFEEDFYDIFPIDPSKRYTLEEKAKIAAYIANIENPTIEKYTRDYQIWGKPTSSLYLMSVDHPEIIEIIKQNNYYGLPHLEEIIDRLPEEAPIPPGDPE